MALEPTDVLMTRRLATVLALLVVFATAAVSAAETAPPAAETCTLGAQQRQGEDCLVCSGWDGDSAKCLKRLSSQGYRQRCRSAGTSTWSEVWCRAQKNK